MFSELMFMKHIYKYHLICIIKIRSEILYLVILITIRIIYKCNTIASL